MLKNIAACGAMLVVLLPSWSIAQEKAAPQKSNEEKMAEAKALLPEGPGKATTVRLCSNCHGAQVVIGKPHSEDGWGAIVADMVQRGAQGTEDELYEVVQYLTKNIKAAPALPKINMNKADAKELEKGLQISSKDAGAIVQAREKEAFKSIDDVKKIPGIDVAKIEAKKSLLVF